MSFKDKLDKELKRRDLNKEDVSDVVDHGVDDKAGVFSFKYFVLGIFLSLIVAGSFAAYAALNQNETQKNIQERLSSKAALVERETILPTMVVQPVVTMLPNETAVANPKLDPVVPVPVVPVEVKPDVVIEDNIANNTSNNVTNVIPDLYESTETGLKPQRREKDGLTVFEAYKGNFQSSNKPKISFVIMDVGLSKIQTSQIIKDMPDNISLAFSPYAASLGDMIKEARNDNHEAWVVLPLETDNYPLNDPGPLTLLKEVSTAQNKDRLDKLLTASIGYVGMIPSPSHSYTPEAVRTSPVMNEILQRGLTVIESRVGAQNFIKQLAISRDAPYAQTDFWLNPEKSQQALQTDLSNILSFAQAKGNALVLLYPYPASLKAVKSFIANNNNQIQLAPASALVRYE